MKSINKVALRKESVDRNVNLRVVDGSKSSVALRKESVDRNLLAIRAALARPCVALRKESVDRNTTIITICIASRKSLSARRAWIEIIKQLDEDFKNGSRSPQGERG